VASGNTGARRPGADRRSVTGRVFRVLDAFGDADRRLTAAELVRRTGLPKSTVHRILADLVDVGMLERAGGGFCLGVHLFELGCLVPPHRRLRELALPFMEDLYEATHEVVHLGILNGSDVLYFVKISGHSRVPLPTRDGARMPAHATALGKAMLAFSPRAVVREVLGASLGALTPYTITVPEVLLRELAEAARTGVAFDHEEAVTGVVCVAAPIFMTICPSVAALSVTGPTHRFDPNQAASAVRLAAAAITRGLGGVRPPTPNSRGAIRT
jgi:DNA-binding IclR family transcriptional regulator